MSVQASQSLNSRQFAARSLSLDQAREALGVSRRTLYYWIKRGRLQTVRTSMGSQRVLMASVNPAGWCADGPGPIDSLIDSVPKPVGMAHGG